ncbi:MAG: glycosyltransferase family 1 protein [Patescibacteria group bacterium]|jgi:glycosyltransferase involved in cell wall biosynthesis
MKKILIDGRFIGIGSSLTIYTLEILSRVLELDKENEYTLLIRPQGLEKLKAYPTFGKSSNFQTKILDVPHYSMAEQTKLLTFLNHKKYDLVHFTQFNHPVMYRGNYVVTIHDLTQFTEFFQANPIKQFAFKKVMQSAARDSAKIISVSETTKQDIVKRFSVKPEKIAVTHLGFDLKYNESVKGQTSKVKDFKEKFGITGDYFLYAGMWKKHKNLVRLIQAYEKFVVDCHSRAGEAMTRESSNFVQLVLMGKPDPAEPEVMEEIKRVREYLNSKFQIPNSIITTGFLPEKSEEQVIGFAGAMAYIIPSLYEGFGLPPLQAMACGTPVLSSNVSCMPEILGDAPLYFDPYDIEDMAKAMARVSTGEKLRGELSTKGLKQAAKYNWSDTAEKTLDVYKSALK